MSRQKMTRKPEEILEECHDIEIMITTKQRADLRRNVATLENIFVIKADKRSYDFVPTKIFISLQNPQRSVVQGKESMLQQLKLYRNNY